MHAKEVTFPHHYYVISDTWLGPTPSNLYLSLFEAIAGGYLAEAGTFLTKREIELLPASVKVITFELGIRFLGDYLRGDTYFKIKYPGHNLHRSRVQFRLLESIEAAEEAMVSTVSRLALFR